MTTFLTLVSDAVQKRPRTRAEQRHHSAGELHVYFEFNKAAFKSIFQAIGLPSECKDPYVVRIAADMVAHVAWRLNQVECLDRRSVDSPFKCTHRWHINVCDHVRALEKLDVSKLSAASDVATLADNITKVVLAPMMCHQHHRRWSSYTQYPQHLKARTEDWKELAEKVRQIALKKKELTLERVDLRPFALSMFVTFWIERFRLFEEEVPTPVHGVRSLPDKAQEPLPSHPRVGLLAKAKRPADRWAQGVSMCLLGSRMDTQRLLEDTEEDVDVDERERPQKIQRRSTRGKTPAPAPAPVAPTVQTQTPTARGKTSALTPPYVFPRLPPGAGTPPFPMGGFMMMPFPMPFGMYPHHLPYDPLQDA